MSQSELAPRFYIEYFHIDQIVQLVLQLVKLKDSSEPQVERLSQALTSCDVVTPCVNATQLCDSVTANQTGFELFCDSRASTTINVTYLSDANNGYANHGIRKLFSTLCPQTGLPNFFNDSRNADELCYWSPPPKHFDPHVLIMPAIIVGALLFISTIASAIAYKYSPKFRNYLQGTRGYDSFNKKLCGFVDGGIKVCCLVLRCCFTSSTNIDEEALLDSRFEQ